MTVGPDLTYNGGRSDAFVAKVQADGTGLVYAGYIGGAGDDVGLRHRRGRRRQRLRHRLHRLDRGHLPGDRRAGPDLQRRHAIDAFVAKVKADGTGLVYCGYIGGSGDDYGLRHRRGRRRQRLRHRLHPLHARPAFPVTVGPDLTYNGGLYDAFVAKVNADGTGLVYCGYIGGSGDDMRLRHRRGRRRQRLRHRRHRPPPRPSFPVRVGPDLTYNGGRTDAFVAKVQTDGTGLVYCGYIGGADDDHGTGIAVDAAGNAYVTGYTSSTEASFPRGRRAGPDLQRRPYDAFVAKVDDRRHGPGLLRLHRRQRRRRRPGHRRGRRRQRLRHGPTSLNAEPPSR